MCRSFRGLLVIIFAFAVYSAKAQMRVTGPDEELLVFENVRFEPGTSHGIRLTHVFGTVRNATAEYLSYVVVQVKFFDSTTRAYPRPAITCKFSLKDLVPGESKEIGEKYLREFYDYRDPRAGLSIERQPVDCNAVLGSLKVSDFSLDLISALHGKHVITTVKPLSRLYRDRQNGLPWDILKDETEVEALDYAPDRESPYKVRILDDDRIGYVTADKIVITPEVDAMRQAALALARETPPSQRGEKEAGLKGEYGSDIAARILGHEFWIGMTQDMALESLGKPQKRSRTLLVETVVEKWEYGSGLSLIFNNGILASFQENR